MKNIIVLLISTVLFIGCGGFQPSNIAKINKSGIISNVDDILYITANANITEKIIIDKWKINNYISETFENNVRFRNKTLTLNDSTLNSLKEYSKWSLKLNDRIKILKPIMKKYKLDSIIYIGNTPKILAMNPQGGLGLSKLLGGIAHKRQALFAVDLYQNINGKIEFNREHFVSIYDADKEFWDKTSNKIIKSKITTIFKNEFKNDLENDLKEFIKKNNL